MIERIIDWCASNRFLVFTGTVILTVWGIWAMTQTPLDAVPDISDVQVIVSTEWMGRSPDLIEDQITYPIVSALISTPHVKAVRGFTDFGISYVYVIFQDGTDMYWARSRVVEYLQGIRGQLPEEVSPVIGPDATGVGWVYEYALVDETGQHSLADLRGFQDWHLRYWLASVPGVAEVAGIGGFVKQYQVNIDPNKLAAYNLGVKDVIQAIKMSNNDVEGRLLEFSAVSTWCVGAATSRPWRTSKGVSLGADPRGTPIRVRDVAQVRLGPDIRRGVAELDGKGEAVGGIVVMRFGENALNVIDGVKAKLKEVQSSMPPGVKVVPTYDRSGLIRESIGTLRHTLIEEAIVVSIVIIIFLFHFRSALIPILALPIAVVASFIPMYYLGVTSNIMSLGGLALAIGVLVDASIVMVENAYRHVGRRDRVRRPARRDRPRREAGRARDLLFARDHRRLVRPGLPAGSPGGPDVPAPRVHEDLCHDRGLDPVHHARARADDDLHSREAAEAGIVQPGLQVLHVAVRADHPAGASVEMDGARPELRGHPPDDPAPVHDWERVHAAAVRGVAALHAHVAAGPLDHGGHEAVTGAGQDPADVPRSRDRLRHGGSRHDLHRQHTDGDGEYHGDPEATGAMAVGHDDRQAPGGHGRAAPISWVPNVWTQPIRNRLDMLLTGIKTPVGIKILGSDLNEIQRIGGEIERALQGIAGTRSVYAERVAQGYFTDIRIDREAIARHGLLIGDVEDVIEAAIGGQNITRTIEGRERYPVNVRYEQGFRDSLPDLQRVLVKSPGGAQIPLAQLASITLTTGPAMVRDENGQLAGYVYVDTATSDIGGYVDRAKQAIGEHVTLPAGLHAAVDGPVRISGPGA